MLLASGILQPFRPLLVELAGTECQGAVDG